MKFLVMVMFAGSGRKIYFHVDNHDDALSLIYVLQKDSNLAVALYEHKEVK